MIFAKAKLKTQKAPTHFLNFHIFWSPYVHIRWNCGWARQSFFVALAMPCRCWPHGKNTWNCDADTSPLVGAFSVIVQLHRLIICSTTEKCRPPLIPSYRTISGQWPSLAGDEVDIKWVHWQMFRSDTWPDLAPGAGWQRVQSWVHLISRYQVQIFSDTDKVIALFRLWIFCCDHWPLTCEVKLSDSTWVRC